MLAVLLPEERDRPLGLRLRAGQLFGHHVHVPEYLGVDEVLDLVEFGPGYLGVVGEVKPQPVGGHQTNRAA